VENDRRTEHRRHRAEAGKKAAAGQAGTRAISLVVSPVPGVAVSFPAATAEEPFVGSQWIPRVECAESGGFAFHHRGPASQAAARSCSRRA